MPRKGYRKKHLQEGQEFGRLTFLREEATATRILCRCRCGKDVSLNRYGVVSGRTVSCGCFNIERATVRIVTQSTVHGQSNTHEHKHWWQMVRRCTDPTFPSFAYYGARGVRIDPTWLGPEGFLQFLTYIGTAPSGKHTIDRIDSAGHYIAGNVRWATPQEQARNTRRNRYITAFGRSQCLAAWADEFRLRPGTLSERLRRGWTPEDALSTPVLNRCKQESTT